MKQAVAYLLPYIDDEKDETSSAKGKILMATVKGDVHDIGKNIVGVVLQCNNYEVIDLGVMVPANDILEAARKENVDLIGLSGLITPSLDEMCHIASEMKRLDFDVPLMIGGATTSKVHTAVKIAPNYDGSTVYVLDASRAVGVASNLLSPQRRDAFKTEVAEEYTNIRDKRASRNKEDSLLKLAEARANRAKIDWDSYTPPVPSFIGTKIFDDYDLCELTGCIDWTPFFRTWELAGNYPKILGDEIVGEAARTLFADAQTMLQQILGERWLTARAVIGFWPASAVGDDVELYKDDPRGEAVSKIHFLRQQLSKREGRSDMCLADFVAPKETGLADYIGGFAVTAGIGIEDKLAEFAAAHDDYNSILLKALADRLAEAFAERMHQRVRTEYWGYEADEDWTNEELIKEKYLGIRPAPGYSAGPDHTEKLELFHLLAAEDGAGMKLTESMAMLPAASVSGYYISHPNAAYFGIGKIGRDQVADYAARKGEPVDVVERWLAANLAYDR